MNCPLHFTLYRQELEKSTPAPEPAALTAIPSVTFTARTIERDKPLGQDSTQGRRYRCRGKAHILEPNEGLDRIAGMQGRQDQMPGERRTERDLGGLQIAQFADQDDIRVLPEHGT